MSLLVSAATSIHHCSHKQVGVHVCDSPIFFTGLYSLFSASCSASHSICSRLHTHLPTESIHVSHMQTNTMYSYEDNQWPLAKGKQSIHCFLSHGLMGLLHEQADQKRLAVRKVKQGVFLRKAHCLTCKL